MAIIESDICEQQGDLDYQLAGMTRRFPQLGSTNHFSQAARFGK
jgi:hypothetical protein